MENIHDLWDKALAEIEKKVSKPSFETWLKQTKANDIHDDQIIITAPNEFARDWLEDHYAELTSDTIEDITGTRLKPKFVIPQDHSDEEFITDPFPKKVKKEEKGQSPAVTKQC